MNKTIRLHHRIWITLLLIIILLSACNTVSKQAEPSPTSTIGSSQPEAILPTATVPEAASQPGPTPSPTMLPVPASTAVPAAGEIHLGLIWPDQGAPLLSRVAVGADGTLYVMDEEYTLHAVTTHGQERWKYEGQHQRASAPVVSGDGSIVYFLAGDSDLMSVGSDGQSWVSNPPQANIIIWAPAIEKPDISTGFLHSDKPTRVWWYANDQLTETDDKLKSIEEYKQRYMQKTASDIWARGYYEFGIVSIAENKQTAKVYVGVSCGPLCGHGLYYTLQRSPSGKWWIAGGELLWQS